jgi:hypothetical protein
MTIDGPVAYTPSRHFQVLGSLWTVYGLFRLIIVVCMLMYGTTATLMFGALLNRVPDPFALMGIFHFLYTVMIALSVISGILGFVAGLALLGEQQSGRRLALIAAVFSLSDIPLGTTLGIFTLVKLLPIRAAHVYERSGQAA